MSAVSRVTFYCDHKGKWRWRFSRNGNVMADSGQGYSRRVDCVSSAEQVLAGICDDPSQPTLMCRIHMQDRLQGVEDVPCVVLKRKPPRPGFNPITITTASSFVWDPKTAYTTNPWSAR